MKAPQVLILLVVVILETFLITSWYYKNIESPKPIIPEKKLIIKNNKVDTVYIYKKL